MRVFINFIKVKHRPTNTIKNSIFCDSKQISNVRLNCKYTITNNKGAINYTTQCLKFK